MTGVTPMHHQSVSSSVRKKQGFGLDHYGTKAMENDHLRFSLGVDPEIPIRQPTIKTFEKIQQPMQHLSE